MTVYDATAPADLERVSGPGDLKPRRHAENPDRPGHALCGARLRPDIRAGDGDCALCEAVIAGTRDWVSR